MPVLHRNDFSGAWDPSSDLINRNPNSFPRFDNVILDERGIVSLRRGYDAAYVYPGPERGVQRVVTFLLNHTIFRVSQIGDSIIINGGRREQNIAGTGDAAIGAGLSEIFWARGTTKTKYNGTRRTWGLAAPADAPDVGAIDPHVMVLSSLDDDEDPGWEAPVGAIGNEDGYDARPGGATMVTPSGNDAELVRVLGAETDFGTYDDGSGVSAIDEDLIEFYVKVNDPREIQTITLMFDCNGGSNNPFADDYFFYDIFPADYISYKPNYEDVMVADPDVQGFDKENALYELRERRTTPVARLRPDRFEETETAQGPTWTRISIPRGRFQRVGSTPGKGWNTVAAIKFVLKCQQAEGGESSLQPVSFDYLTISGGEDRPLTGKYVARYLYEYDSGNYVSRSGWSPASQEIELKNNGLGVTIPDDPNRDEQITAIWVMLMGGTLNQFYRFARTTNTVGAVGVNVTKSEKTAVIENITTDTDLTTPPDDIIDIVGDHYDRIFALTERGLYPSKQRMPDSFALGQVMEFGKGEMCLWVRKYAGDLYVGTDQDVYRISGSWAELPDGTLDVRREPLGVQYPPAARHACIVEGNLFVYLASDGWRVITGGITNSILGGSTELIYRGYDRFGVGQVNLGAAPGRMQCALHNNQLWAIVAESGMDEGSPYVHVYDFARQHWYRFVYPITLMSIHKEPNGLLVAGDDSNTVWYLDHAATDNGSPINVEIWTKSDDDGRPLQMKEAWDSRLECDTGGATVSIAYHVDEASTPALTITGSKTGSGTIQRNVSALPEFRRIQARITGAFTTFKMYSYGLVYRARPIPRLYYNTGPVDLGNADLYWLREITIKARSPVNLTVTPYFDDVAFPSLTLAASPAVTTTYELLVGRGYKGRQPRIVIEAPPGSTEAQGFELFWVEFYDRQTGVRRQKPLARVAVTDDDGRI